MFNYRLIIIIALFYSCEPSKNLTPNELRIGTFKTFLNNNEVTSIATRNSNFQIETFNQKIDTFHIKWHSNFEYELLSKTPKTALDKIPFIVKITGVHNNYYTFRANYKGSKYVQAGRAERVNK